MSVVKKKGLQSGVRKKILLLGGSSYIGRHLLARLSPQKVIATYYKTPIDNGIYFDSVSMSLSEVIEDPQEISHAVILLGESNPETCAADIARSKALNVESIKRIIDYLKEWQIKPIFTSSEFVFDGKKGNYIESDPINPILIYGKQKVEIERYLQKVCDDYAILRLSKVFGSQLGDGTIFANWLTAIEKNHTIKCSQDQIFSPVYIDDVVEGIVRVFENNCKGIFHLSGRKSFARIELLEMLLTYINKYSSANIKVMPCSIHDFELREKRPLNISMIPDKLIKSTGMKLSDVEYICEKIVRRKFQRL